MAGQGGGVRKGSSRIISGVMTTSARGHRSGNGRSFNSHDMVKA